MTLTIEQVVSLIPSWQGRPVTVSPMTGGLTNTNFRVDVDGTPYFVRIPGAGTELLAVDRVNEIHNARAAAETGVAPPLLHVLPDDNITVFGFIDGRTMSIESLQASGVPGRIAASLQPLHAGPRGGRRPPPCHNDLLAENYIDDGRQLWLIDFKYSGNNDPCFELGNTCQELQYSEAQMAELCSAYFGQATASLLARMRLFALMSDVGWTLWGALQAKISTIDYDFWDYATTRWNRALAVPKGTDLANWLGGA